MPTLFRCRCATVLVPLPLPLPLPMGSRLAFPRRLLARELTYASAPTTAASPCCVTDSSTLRRNAALTRQQRPASSASVYLARSPDGRALPPPLTCARTALAAALLHPRSRLRWSCGPPSNTSGEGRVAFATTAGAEVSTTTAPSSSEKMADVRDVVDAEKTRTVPAMATPGVTRVGWIGTGVMGQAMCGHLMDAGFTATVFNRTISKAEPLKVKGATIAMSPRAVAEQSDVVFTIVGYPSDVKNVILGEDGVLEGLPKGGVIVDMTTSEPTLAKEIFEEARKRGCFAVDAPVSGGDKGAKSGSLAIMAGGEPEVVKALGPLFRCMGKVTYLGGAGSGQSCKLGNQVTIASTMVGLVEGMLYAHRAGLDVSTFLQAIAGGAAGSKSLDLYAPRIQKRDFDPGFFVNHFVKDLGIAIEESRRMNLSLPGLALAQQLYISLKAHGEGHLGTQALILALERLNNLELPKSE